MVGWERIRPVMYLGPAPYRTPLGTTFHSVRSGTDFSFIRGGEAEKDRVRSCWKPSHHMAMKSHTEICPLHQHFLCGHPQDPAWSVGAACVEKMCTETV